MNAQRISIEFNVNIITYKQESKLLARSHSESIKFLTNIKQHYEADVFKYIIIFRCVDSIDLESQRKLKDKEVRETPKNKKIQKEENYFKIDVLS